MAATVHTRRPRLPVLTWIPGYQRAWLSRDAVAGLAAGAVVIPQAMAYASIAGLPAQFGLYTCMVPMTVYVLIGGSRAMSVSTTSTIAVLTGSTLLAAGIAAGTEDPARTLASLTLLVGLILIGARLLHLGALVDNISDATLTGIKVGVGLTVAAGQLPALLGFAPDPDADSFFSELRSVLRHLGDISWVTVAFSAGTLAVLLILRRVAPRLPGPLVAVIGGILLVAVLGLDDHGVALIAEVPSGLPTPVAPTWRGLDQVVPGAFAIAIMVFLETLAVARAVRRPTEPPIDNDQELLASGLACGAGAFFRAMPAAGGFSQTAINQNAGARTQLSEAVTVVLAVGCALFLGGVLSDLPQATLACLVIVAVLGLIDIGAFVEFWKLSRIEFWVAVVTAAAGLTLGLLAAVLLGVILTLFLVIVELDRVGITELQPSRTDDDVLVAGADTVAEPGLLMLRLDGPLYTANVHSVIAKVLDAVDARPGTDTLIMDNVAMARLTVTVVHQMEEVDRELAERHVRLWVAGMPQGTLRTVEHRDRWRERVAAGEVYTTPLAALRAFRAERNPTAGA